LVHTYWRWKQEMDIEKMKAAFSNYTFVFEYETEKKDESVSAGLKDFDLFVNAKNKEQAVHDLAVELVEYSKEYLNNIQLYFNATNRRDHFPFVMNVLLQEDLAEVIKLIHTEQP
jgi:antitoxin YefM